MQSVLDRARARSQTSIVVKYLAACCAVCNAIHSDELHAAVLRLREPLPPRDALPPRCSTPDKLQAHLLEAVTVCCKCGVSFPSLNPSVARMCADCANKARLKSVARSNKQRPKSHKKDWAA